MRLRLDDERKVEFNPQQHPHVDLGYAVTSYPAKARPPSVVLVNVDTEFAAKDLLNSRMAYVSISRGQCGRANLHRQSGKAATGLGS